MAKIFPGGTRDGVGHITPAARLAGCHPAIFAASEKLLTARPSHRVKLQDPIVLADSVLSALWTFTLRH